MYSDETIEAMAAAAWNARGGKDWSTCRGLLRQIHLNCIRAAARALESTAEQKALRAAPVKDIEWDYSMHTNPSAQAWAAAFAKMYPACNVPEDVMLGWFSNAMMAMHDFLKGGGPINGGHAQFLIDEAARAGK